MSFNWTPENVDALKRLYPDTSLSFAAIAKKLGAPSRNAVIGKVNRLGLKPRGNGKAQAAERARQGKPAISAAGDCAWGGKRTARAHAPKPDLPVPAPAPEPDPVPPPTRTVLRCESVTLDGLETNSCRWPLGDPRDLAAFRFCGAPRAAPSHPFRNYCAEHERVAYAPRPSRGGR